MSRYDYSEANCPKIEELAGLCTAEFPIDTELYTKYDVKRGLRDLNGKGVLAGLTHIGNVCASKIVDGQSVPCTPKETEILWTLASNPGMVFSREHLLQSIWGYDFLGDTRAVDSHIKRIRAKLCNENNEIGRAHV